jgi:ribosomal protein S18 acetylase RimI-like enzyme
MVYYRDESVLIRSMEENDVPLAEEGFRLQGWNKPASTFTAYLSQQRDGTRFVFASFHEGLFAGYVTLRKAAEAGPFTGKGYPEISDFNVLVKFRRRGIGSLLMDAAEGLASSFSDTVSLGVGLHAGYGTAQRMYIKRGYIPDGSGVWYLDRPLTPYTECRNDDDLVLYLSKKLTGA